MLLNFHFCTAIIDLRPQEALFPQINVTPFETGCKSCCDQDNKGIESYHSFPFLSAYG